MNSSSKASPQAVASTRTTPGPGGAATDAVCVTRRDDGPVCWLTIDRPHRGNSISAATHEELIAHLDTLRDDRSIAVIILSGTGGKIFCAGHDLTETVENLSPEGALKELHESAELMRAFRNQPQIIIARVEGVATAAGCQLVAGADLAVAARGARFATPGVNIGLWCYGPMVELSRNVGTKRAMQMLAMGELIDAECARQIGLINEVVDRDELDGFVTRMARHIASRSSKSFELGKRAFYQQLEMSADDAYEHVGKVKAQHVGHADVREGIQAFLDKRTPKWIGR